MSASVDLAIPPDPGGREARPVDLLTYHLTYYHYNYSGQITAPEHLGLKVNPSFSLR